MCKLAICPLSVSSGVCQCWVYVFLRGLWRVNLLMPLYPHILSRFTLCLKFRRIRISDFASVAIAQVVYTGEFTGLVVGIAALDGQGNSDTLILPIEIV